MPRQQCDYRIIFKWLSSILSLHQVKNKPKIFWASLHLLGKHGPMLARVPVPNHLTGHKQFFCFCWLLFCPAHHNTVAQKCSSKLSACSTSELTFLDYIKGGLWQLVAFQTLTLRVLVKQEDSNNEQLQRKIMQKAIMLVNVVHCRGGDVIIIPPGLWPHYSHS